MNTTRPIFLPLTIKNKFHFFNVFVLHQVCQPRVYDLLLPLNRFDFRMETFSKEQFIFSLYGHRK